MGKGCLGAVAGEGRIPLVAKKKNRIEGSHHAVGYGGEKSARGRRTGAAGGQRGWRGGDEAEAGQRGWPRGVEHDQRTPGQESVDADKISKFL